MNGRRLFSLILAVLALTALPLLAYGSDDASEVRRVIEDSYVKGIHINRDIPAVRKGFHPSFTMFIKNGNDIRTLSIDEWIESIEKRKKEDPEGPGYAVTHKIPFVELTGGAAVAKVLIYRDGELVYSDYMSLYRFEDGWKIVGKIFHSHKG